MSSGTAKSRIENGKNDHDICLLGKGPRWHDSSAMHSVHGCASAREWNVERGVECDWFGGLSADPDIQPEQDQYFLWSAGRG